MVEINASFTDSLEVQFGAGTPTQSDPNAHAFTAQGIDVLDSAELNGQTLGLPAGFGFVAEYQIGGTHDFNAPGTPTVAHPSQGSIQILAVQGQPTVSFGTDGTPVLNGAENSFVLATGTLRTPESMLQVGSDGSVSGALDWQLQGGSISSIVIHPVPTVSALNASTLDLSNGQGAATLLLSG